MNHVSPDILKQDIHELGISRSLVHFFELNRLNTLQELLNCPMEEWFSFTGFSQHLLNELMNYLEEKQLILLVSE